MHPKNPEKSNGAMIFSKWFECHTGEFGEFELEKKEVSDREEKKKNDRFSLGVGVVRK